MRQELDELLCQKYPKIFRDRQAPMTESCMHWGFECDDGWFNIIDQLCDSIQRHIDQNNEQRVRAERYNSALKAAFDGDIERFITHLAYSGSSSARASARKRADEVLAKAVPDYRRVPPEKVQVVATQVKEKYGTLRFYYNRGDEFVSGLVAMAEAMSGVTCEICGTPGKPRGGRWIRTLCDEHAGDVQIVKMTAKEFVSKYVNVGSNPHSFSIAVLAVETYMERQKVFKYQLNDTVGIEGMLNPGTIMGRAEYLNANNQYFVKYINGSGNLVREWLDEEDIHHLEPLSFFDPGWGQFA